MYTLVYLKALPVAPNEVLNMVKCGSSTSNPYKTKQFSYNLAKVVCSLIYNCCREKDICWNEVRKRQSKEDDGSDDGKS